MKRINKKFRGYTLNELLVTLIIIGIIILIAIPILMPLITKAKSLEAKQQLAHVHMLQKGHFYAHSKYSNNLNEIGFEHEKVITEGGKANYQIEIVEASITGFKAKATALVDFDGDGQFNVWEIDENKNLIETVQD